MYDVLKGLSQGYLYPVQEFYYTDLLFPTSVTKVILKDQDGKTKMEIDIVLIQTADVVAEPSLYVPGSEGRPKMILYYLYDTSGNKIPINI